MANNYDNPSMQFKQFKFYNFSTSRIVETIAANEQQARKKLSNNLIFVAPIWNTHNA